MYIDIRARIHDGPPTWYQLPEDQCERLTKTEMTSMTWLLSAVSSLTYSMTDMKNRLSMIPNGLARLRMASGQVKSVVNDIIGTIPQEQCRRFNNQMKDSEIRIVPKFAPAEYRMTLNKEEAMQMIDLMQVACKECILDGEECRKCVRYKMCTAFVPLDDYGSGHICPYSTSRWE